jgi:hypothetical protein
MVCSQSLSSLADAHASWAHSRLLFVGGWDRRRQRATLVEVCALCVRVSVSV